ncbi:MAG: hypothetical protein QJR03_01830 [Sphaerobacter sp.]|nr:hypothetical protein [Sphaerobacter sp.]
MHAIVRGGLAGVAATGVMSLVMAAGRAAGLLDTPPPQHITARVEEAAGIRHRLSGPVFQSSWMLAHLGYGAVCGMLFSAGRDRLPPSNLASGLMFGGLVWEVSYLGLMPGLRLYPWPAEDAPSRQGVMIAAHAVYGVALAVLDRLLGGGARGARPRPAGR